MGDQAKRSGRCRGTDAFLVVEGKWELRCALKSSAGWLHEEAGAQEASKRSLKQGNDVILGLCRLGSAIWKHYCA